MKNEVRPPRAPSCTTPAPGTRRSASETSIVLSASSVRESSTVTGAPVCETGSCDAAAVTTTVS
jgi:hypothetical protein